MTVSSDVPQGFTQLDLVQASLSGIAGANDVSPNQDFSVFALTLTEQEASLSVPIFSDGQEEGIVPITFTLEEGEGYTIADEVTPITVQLVDDPSLLEGDGGDGGDGDGNGTDLPLVSLTTGSDFLVESEGTVSAHVFNVTGAPLPEGG